MDVAIVKIKENKTETKGNQWKKRANTIPKQLNVVNENSCVKTNCNLNAVKVAN